VLSHRLGLIPLAVDPAKLQFKPDGEEGSTEDTLVYRLEVECIASSDGKPAVNQKVYSDQLQWSPQLGQEQTIGSANPVHKDILIAELRPGQRICLEAHAVKGYGKDHTKFSPVATASYRLLPGTLHITHVY
jgi:DNA-directed RNA polymerases I and III subunit RPAC1